MAIWTSREPPVEPPVLEFALVDPTVSSIFADRMTANFRREVFLVGPVKSPEALSRWINACAKSKDGPRRYISDHTLVKAAATE